MCFEEITCPRCSSKNIVKNGRTSNKKQKYLCKDCRRQFITDYTYQGCRKEIRSLIVPMTLNGSGIRDITRVLGISINTVLKEIRLEASKAVEEKLPKRILEVEIDEMWSFIEKKENQSWLWYAFDARRKKVLAWVTGDRTDQSCKRLLEKLKDCHIVRFCTDAWESYEKFIDSFRHWVGKEWTRNIERNNLNIRTRVKRFQRRTICFSKKDDMHDAVLSLFFQHSNHAYHKF